MFWRRSGENFRWLFIAVLISAATFLNLPAAQAVGLNIEISPLPIILNTQPNNTVTADLRMMNLNDSTENFKITLLKVSADNQGNVSLEDPGLSDEWTKWISFSKTHFAARSREWQTIKMTINVPKSAAFGYYFAVGYSHENEAIDPTKPSLLGKVATMVLMDVNAPGAKKEGSIASFTSAHKVYEYLPANFQVKIQNTGNLTIIPHGDIFINHSSSRDIGDIQINSTAGRVLPSSARIFTASWTDGFPHYAVKTDKKGNPTNHLAWDFTKLNHFRFGHYTANLLIIYDNGTRDVPLEGTLSFWVIPWRMLLILLAVLLVVGFGFYSAFRNIRQRTRRKKRR